MTVLAITASARQHLIDDHSFFLYFYKSKPQKLGYSLNAVSLNLEIGVSK